MVRRLSTAALDAMLEAVRASEANPPPPLNVPLPGSRRAGGTRVFPETFWPLASKGRRFPFGTDGVLLTVRQAQRRRLAVFDTTFHVFIPTCRTKDEEDRRLRAYERRASSCA